MCLVAFVSRYMYVFDFPGHAVTFQSINLEPSFLVSLVCWYIFRMSEEYLCQGHRVRVKVTAAKRDVRE